MVSIKHPVAQTEHQGLLKNRDKITIAPPAIKKP